MVMSRIVGMVVGVAVLVVCVAPGRAAVLCSKKKGAVLVRDTACKPKEVQLNVTDFGAIGVASTLGSGQSLTGPWSVSAGIDDWAGLSVQFRLPLAAPIAGANTHYLARNDPPTAECPGYGQAAAGHLCIYTNEGNPSGIVFSAIYHNEGDLTASVAGAGVYGFHLYFSSNATDTYLSGTYTVTAP